MCHQSAQHSFEFSCKTVARPGLGTERLTPAASAALARQLGLLQAGMTIPLPMHRQHGFFADAPGGVCLPRVIRDYRVETVSESAISASLEEMTLADMGIAWLAGEMIAGEQRRARVVALGAELGAVELDIVLYDLDEGLASRLGEMIAAMRRES